MPRITLEELRTGERLNLDDQTRRAYNPFVVFTADCPVCSLSSYLRSLQLLNKSLENKGQRLMPIFSSRFSREQLLEEANAHRIDTPMYLAVGELPGFEDAYYLRSFTSQVVVLSVDLNGVVNKVQTIGEYLNAFKSQEATR